MNILTLAENSPTVEFSLRCPCGSDMTHFAGLAAFMRQEDAPTGTLTLIDAGGTHVAEGDPLRDNPSVRRDGIRLYFTCEDCDGFMLVLYQHKGNTFVYTKRMAFEAHDCEASA